MNTHNPIRSAGLEHYDGEDDTAVLTFLEKPLSHVALRLYAEQDLDMIRVSVTGAETPCLELSPGSWFLRSSTSRRSHEGSLEMIV